ncbi:MAG: DUF1559 domain-containing protein [Capsulimonadaceae bacterium]|nr:DUF1559 domain-containing protein [Capsulimonadaceae bacterium]
MMQTMQSKNGFTLIELLVVIAIIAILAAILFPVFATAREKARQSACASNFKQMGLAMIQYTQDYDEQPPDGVTRTNSASGWAGQIYPYLKSAKVYVCPDDQTPGASCSYVYNRNTQNETATNFTRWVTNWPTFPLSQYANVSKTILLAEVTGSAGYDVSSQDPNNTKSDLYLTAHSGGGFTGGFSPDGKGGAGDDYDPDSANYSSTDQPCWAESTGCAAGFTLKYVTGYPSASLAVAHQLFTSPTGVHSGGANYLLADGHVKWLMGSQVSAGGNSSSTAGAGDCGNDVTGSIWAANTKCTNPGAVITWSIY